MAPPVPSTARLAARWLPGRAPGRGHPTGGAHLETACCARLLAVTYQATGLLPGRRPDRYDPGSFWSGDNPDLPAGPGTPPAPAAPRR